ncbi:hypothetical protein Clacol_002393 [Clathrus columnatus]|uniref:NTF2-like protein n=1 Tax=Clathrus columnatus TaxID=1419009 RepID=A0AAV5A8F4_9AGAM|nr:hypothetical protein Clacol_002393 [Clathrus columnatus]
MFSAASERPRRTFTAALKGAGLLDKNDKEVGTSDKDTKMADASAGGVKRTHKMRPYSGHLLLLERTLTKPSSGYTLQLASRSHGSPVPVNIRGASKLAMASKLPRRSLDPRRSPMTHTPPNTIDVWREIIHRRWNPGMQFLNLERVTSEENLKKLNRMSGPLTVKEAAVIFKLASQLNPEVLSLSLANNDFSSVQSLSTLSHFLPGLRNLSLANNKLRYWKDLDSLITRKGKFLNLKELVLSGNPMREVDMTPARLERYRTEILRRFPTLELLDSEVITKIAFDAPSSSTAPSTLPNQGPTSFPVEISGSLIAQGLEGIVADFLTRFFLAYDSGRASLLEVYGPNATFSFSANTSIPPRARVQGHHNTMPNQKKLEWTPYVTGGSRNLSRVHNVARAEQSLHTGTDDIVKKLMALPGTKHDLSSQEKFVVDAWPVAGVLPMPGDASTVLFLSVHGEFEEEPSHGVRSFDRTFILAPALDGSRAKLAGWQVVILSDQFVIRSYSSHEAWRPGPIRMSSREDAQAIVSNASSQSSLIQPQSQPPAQVLNVSTNLSPAQQQQLMNDPILPSLPEQQRLFVITLSQRTGLNASFSMQCLDGNGWDGEKALANFEAVRVGVLGHFFFRDLS